MEYKITKTNNQYQLLTGTSNYHFKELDKLTEQMIEMTTDSLKRGEMFLFNLEGLSELEREVLNKTLFNAEIKFMIEENE